MPELRAIHQGLADSIDQTFMLCAPPPKLTVSEWADKRRVMSSNDARPGKWRTSEVEPMRAVMDAINHPEVREVVVQKGTQVGFTELLLNTVGYLIDLDPCPILWLLPDQKAVDEISKNRLDPMLSSTPVLRGKVKPKRSRDSGNTIAAKQFPGGRLAIVGSHAPNDISSRPIRMVICDETDRYALSAGVDGDPMALAAKRQTWFWNRKTIKGSSPTTKERSVIAREYRLSDMRECWVGCPHCGEKQILRWSGVKWDSHLAEDGKTKVHKPETASYQCEACGVLWDDEDRFEALRRVKPDDWRPTKPFRGIAGFHFPQFLSTKVLLSEMVTEFLTAFGKLPNSYPDVEKMKVWTNTVLAECWEERGEVVDPSNISSRGEPYGPNDMPAEAIFATAGVDVQGDRIEVQVVAWGQGEEAWPARYVIIPGDPSQPQIWNELDELLREPLTKADGRILRIFGACIDTGGHHSAEVYAFCARPGMRQRRIFPIKGDDGPKPIWPVRFTLTKTKKQVWIVGVDTAKDSIYGRLKIRPKTPGEPNPGFIHFPLASEEAETAEFNSDYFAQLTSEKVVTKRNERGRMQRQFVLPAGKRNEALDTFVYALAARLATRIRLDRLLLRAPSPELVTEEPPEPTPTQSSAVPAIAPSAVKTVPRVQPKRLRDPAAIARMFRQ